MSLNDFIENPLRNTDNIFKDSKGICVVDFSQIVMSTLLATYKPNDDMNDDMVRHLIINTLKANVIKFKHKYPDIVIALDNPSGGYWRAKVAPYYKCNRKDQRDKSGYDWKTIFKGIDMVKEELKAFFPLYVMDIKSLEADDIIATIVKKYRSNIPVLIISSDGDFTQLHTTSNVKQWSPIQDKWVTHKHGSPSRDLWYKVIKGDSKDGVACFKADSDHYAKPIDEMTGKKPRAPSIKKVLLEELIDSTIQDMDEVRNKVTESEFKRIRENLILLDLNNIPQKIENFIIKTLNNYVKPNGSDLYNYTIQHRLSKIRTNIQDFL